MNPKLWIFGCAAFALAFDLSVAGQARPSDKVTVRGCLQRGTPTSASTTGVPRPAEDAFVITNARVDGSATSGKGVSYDVEGKSSELRKHAGHEVELTGRMDNSAVPAPASTSAGPDYGPRLRVESVKMISASCPAK